MSENEKLEELRTYFSEAEHYLSEASSLIDELQGSFEPDEAGEYFGRLTGFMCNLASDLQGFVSEMAEGRKASLSFMYPDGLDPKSLFFPDEK